MNDHSKAIAKETNARTRTYPGFSPIAKMLAPALVVVIILFGGGLVLGLIQSLGHLPAAGLKSLTFKHFINVIGDPDFARSLILTLYVALSSTAVAAVISMVMAIFLLSLSEKSRLIHFIFQIPLTVPHLVIAVAMVFMLTPTGLLFYRYCAAAAASCWRLAGR